MAIYSQSRAVKVQDGYPCVRRLALQSETYGCKVMGRMARDGEGRQGTVAICDRFYREVITANSQDY